MKRFGGRWKSWLWMTILLVSSVASGHAADLHQAAADGNLALVKTLVAEGASVTAVDTQGMTPRNHAELAGHREVFHFLLEREALTTEDVPLILRQPRLFDEDRYLNQHLSRLLGDNLDRSNISSVDEVALAEWHSRTGSKIFPEHGVTQDLLKDIWITDPIIARLSHLQVGVDCHVCVTRLWYKIGYGLNRMSRGGCQSPDKVGGLHSIAIVNVGRLEEHDWQEVITRYGAACSTLK